MEENDDLVHLAVSTRRKRLFVFAFNIMPLVILCLVPPIFIFYDNGIPFAYIVLMAICALTASIALFFRKLIHEVAVSNKSVVITSVKAMKKSTQSVSLQDVSRIYLEVYRGKGGGAFFRLIMNNGQKVEFINIPYLFMERQNIQLICQRLREITGLEIKGDYLASKILNQ